ncbi:MAG: serine hydrolase [Patescibacteria group bacterium]|jgi:D-alanyl-D-alanine endopeptidase (penicillin-binding protein 7)
MFQLILSLVASIVLTSSGLPVVARDFSVEPILLVQSGGDEIGSAGHLPLAANKEINPDKVNENSLGIETSARSGVAVDGKTGKVLWEKNSSQIRSIASLTKLMTALVFLDHNPGWDSKIKITTEDQHEGGVAFFAIGEEVTVRDLFYSALSRSINSAAAALARSTGLNEKDFVFAMNQKADELGMVNSHFIEPTGLHTGNVATAIDVVILLREALSKTAIANATTLTAYTTEILNKDLERTADNTNLLLKSFLNKPPYKILGGKTGYLVEAGYCLAIGVEKSDHQIYSVVLGSDSIGSRFTDTKAIVDWVFSNYSWQK